VNLSPRRFQAGAVPPYLIVPIREGAAKAIMNSDGAYLWRGRKMPAFETWEGAVAYSRKMWRRKTTFLILNGPAMIDDHIPVFGEKGAYWIEGDMHRRYALNLHLETRRQVSAGGVVRYRSGDDVMHALIQVRRKGTLRWEIPKGKIKRHENLREAAIREVKEETGLESEIRSLEPLGKVDYLFLTDSEYLYFKTVHYFLLESDKGGELTPREEEGISDARWFPADNAWEIVSFPNLRPILRRAVERGRNL
jgi:8-oxo-dGTP pyrophosphatase MutT (NUDIX family)